MKRKDIQIGKKYQVEFWLQSVTCRVISKHWFGFRIGCEWTVNDTEYNVHYSRYGYKWSWKFVEEA